MPTQEYPISKIKEKVEEKVVSDYVSGLAAKLPGKLKLFKGDSVDVPANEYPFEIIWSSSDENVFVENLRYIAGSRLKWITVAVYDRQKQPKIVEKKILGKLLC